MSFDATTYNSIKGSYLLRMQVKPYSPSQGGNNPNQPPGADTGPPVMEDFIRNSEHKRKLQERRNRIDTEKNGNMHEMLQRLARGRQEVTGLQRELALEKNPFKRQMLEANLGHKSAGTSLIEHSLASSYDSGGSGFVGSENRIDYVGSFVTFG